MTVENRLDAELEREVEAAFDFEDMYREMANISGTHGWAAMALQEIGQYNPDDIDIATYKMMLDDEQVGAGVDVIRLAVLSTNWNINYTGNDARMQDEIVPWLDNQLRNVNSSLGGAKGLNQVIWEMLLAIAYGHVPCEIVLRRPKDVNGRIELSMLKPIDPETIRKFDVDRKNNLLGLYQSSIGNTPGAITFTSPGEGQYIDRKKLLIYSHNMSFHNWWGKSDLRRIYRSWFTKQFIIKFWNIAIEKYALPFTVGKSEDKTHNKALLQQIRMLQKTSAIVLDDGKSIDFLKGVVDRGAFEGAIEYHDKKILSGLLIPPSTLESTSGAYSQSRVQQTTFMLRVKSLQKAIEGVMEQLLRLLVDLNFSNVRGEYPSFNFEEPSVDDIIQMSNAINASISAGYIDVESDFRWIRERLGFPEAEPHAVIKRGSAQQMPGPNTTRPGLFKEPEIQSNGPYGNAPF